MEKATVKGLGREMALLDLVGKMYSKIHSQERGGGTNHKDTKDTKIDPMSIKLITQNLEEPPASIINSDK